MCERELCVFAFQTLGVMNEAADEIATGAQVLPLIRSYFHVRSWFSLLLCSLRCSSGGSAESFLLKKIWHLIFVSPLLNLCFIILQWPRGEIKQFSFKNNCLAWLKKSHVCVFHRFVFVLFGWFCFSVVILPHSRSLFIVSYLFIFLEGFPL